MKWLITLLVVFTVYGCNNYDHKKISELKKDIKYMESSFGEDEHFLYAVDASCSVCILDAIYFIIAYNRSRVDIPCYMLVSESNKEIFSYYLKQLVTETNVQIMYRYEEYPFGISTRGVLYKSDNVDNIIGRLK